MRYNHFQKTLEIFLGSSKPTKPTPHISLTPAAGVQLGYYRGFSIECYIDTNHLTGLNQISVTNRGNWLYHLTDLHLLKMKPLDIGIGEQLILISNQSHLKIGPFIKARWKNFYCKIRFWKPTQWAGNLVGLEFSW
jgi:hypothetical protein